MVHHPTHHSVRCPGALWQGDGFGRCQQQRYVQLYPVAAVLAIAAAYTAYAFSKTRGSTAESPEEESELAHKHVLEATGASNDDAHIVIRTRTFGDMLRLNCEAVLNLGLVLLLVLVWLSPSVSDQYAQWAPNLPVVLLVAALYTLGLVVYRNIKARQVTKLTAAPFAQVAILDSVFVVVFAIEWYSQLLHPYSAAAWHMSVALVAVSLAAWLIVFSSPLGDATARLYTAQGSHPSTEPTSSLLRSIACSWNSDMIIGSRRKTIEPADVWDLDENQHMYMLFERFKKLDANRSFVWRLIVCLRKPIILNLTFGLLGSLAGILPAVFVRQILAYVEDPSAPRAVAWLFVFGLGFAELLAVCLVNQAFYQGRLLSLGVRGLIIGSVYHKALYRQVATHTDDDSDSEEDKDETEFDPNSTGAVINLMSVDSFKVSDFSSYLHDPVASPVVIIAAVYYLYRVLGWSALMGVAVMILNLPLNGWMAKKYQEVEDKLMAVTDRRIEKTNEVLQAIRIVKFFAWEDRFEKSILETRDKELHLLYLRALYWTFQGLTFFLLPVAFVAVSFWSYVYLQGEELTNAVAFTSLAIFQVIRYPLDTISNVITRVTSCRVALRRISVYLSEPDTPKYDQLSDPYPEGPTEVIGFENASFTWNGASTRAGSDAFRLRDLDVKFEIGDLNVIIGPTGSGKTSLLLALLGEMKMDSGKVFLPTGNRRHVTVDESTGLTDTVAYAPQQAWLVNESIRKNILFASPYDKTRYNAVLDACELRRDLEILSKGDRTLIGDKGIALSGGQKQRISLARVLYSNSQHLILDDCLSAVDSHTAKALYANAITGPLALGRTIILVSHNVALTVGKAAKVVVVRGGRITAQGTPSELSKSGALGADDLVNRNAQSATESRQESQQVSRVSSLTKLASLSDATLVGTHEPNPEEQLESAVSRLDETLQDDSTDGSLEEDGEHDEEERAVGAISLATYNKYFTQLGGLSWLIPASMLLTLDPFGRYAESWWIKQWATYGMAPDEPVLGTATTARIPAVVPAFVASAMRKTIATFESYGISSDVSHSLGYYCGIYVVIGVSVALFCVLRDVTFLFGSVRGARRIFKKLLTSIVHARVRFFDATPIGRITNRFSKDIETVDQEIATNIMFFVLSVIDNLSITVVISIVTPQFIPAAVLITLMFVFIGGAYLACSRQLKRLESTARSPIFQQFGETLAGAVTIRAFGDNTRFEQTNWNAVDASHRPYFWLWLANRWLGFWCGTMSMMVAVAAAFFVVLNSENIGAGMAGISLSYAMGFGDSVLWSVRMYSMMEIDMNSVERIEEYVNVEQEAPGIIPESRPPQNWPSKGTVEFKKLSLKYSPDLPLVIKNVSFKVEGGLKVGVVGRTGAGKSTIITALFRLLEPVSGSIEIDGLDISTIGLQDLRRSLAIIPQDPTLFRGTLRTNLDMFDEYTDDEIFDALEKVQLVPEGTTAASHTEELGADENANKFLNLSSEVTEGGQNLSQGQRQLLCLARSILKKPRILLLDEATASIDYETDAMIQHAIRKAFTNVTLLTIAHRLRTIADYDRILMLEQGEVAQYGTPVDLLKDKEGLFYQACVKSGEMDALVALANGKA